MSHEQRTKPDPSSGSVVTFNTSGIRDGRESIEHQLEIHIIDLQETTANLAALVNVANSDTVSCSNIQNQILEILAGIKYVMDYRLKGRRMPNLNAALCKRLAELLLDIISNTTLKKRSFRGKRVKKSSLITVQAECAMVLFGEFLEEVDDFATAVGHFNLIDLETFLRLHCWINEQATPAQLQYGITVLGLLVRRVPMLSTDWKEYIKEGPVQIEVESCLRKNNFFEAIPTHMPQKVQSLFPPQNLSFDRDVERVLDMYQCGINSGLTYELVRRNSEHYGKNALPVQKPESLLLILWRQVSDFMILAMIVSICVLSIIEGTPFAVSTILLIAVVLINVIVGFWQDYSGSRAISSLSSLSTPYANVLRQGTVQRIDATNLVPGDLVILEEGDRVPADLRLVWVSQLETIESVLTGETAAVRKSLHKIRIKSRRLPLSDCKGNVFMGTVVSKGRAKGIVVRVGTKTEIGKISHSLTSESKGASSLLVQTPLQRKLTSLGKKLVIIALVLCVAIGILLYFRNGRKNLKEVFKLVIDLAVSVIPEGLVAVVSFTMTMAVRRLAKRKVLVARMSSAETLGSVTVICSDKTGTLTEGKMIAKCVWTCDGRPLMLDGKMDATQNPIDYSIFCTMFLCNNATLQIDERDSTKLKGIGDSTEIALKLGCVNAGFSSSGEEWSEFCYKINEFAFDSDRKLMSVVYRTTPSSNDNPFGFVLVKGAPEMLLQKCNYYLKPLPEEFDSQSVDTDPTSQSLEPTYDNIVKTINGHQALLNPLDDAFVELALKENGEMAGKGLRVLGLAFKAFNESTQEWNDMNQSNEPNLTESNLVFLGLVGIIDSPRPGVEKSIQECHNAGIKVCMITGDQLKTAIAVAEQIGIYSSNDPSRSQVMSGETLDLLSDQNIAALNPFPCVFARVSPENKLAIVRCLQSTGHFVAMTGDGVNDAPAIKKADVGVAMGLTGTEITKQAADIVLLNDDFPSIVVAVREGRRIFDNIRKFLIYLLSCNAAEVVVGMSSVYFKCIPVSDTGILLANILADIPPSLSLGFEPPEADIMCRQPKDPKGGIFTSDGLILMAIECFFIAGVTIANFSVVRTQYILSDPEKTYEHASSVAYATISILQILLALLSKSTTLSIFQVNIFDNWKLLLSVIVSAALVVLSLGLKRFLPKIVYQLVWPETNYVWLAIFVECILLVFVVELAKFCIRLKTRSHLSSAL